MTLQKINFLPSGGGALAPQADPSCVLVVRNTDRNASVSPQNLTPVVSTLLGITTAWTDVFTVANVNTASTGYTTPELKRIAFELQLFFESLNSMLAPTWAREADQIRDFLLDAMEVRITQDSTVGDGVVRPARVFFGAEAIRNSIFFNAAANPNAVVSVRFVSATLPDLQINDTIALTVSLALYAEFVEGA